jgi:hypothetical protein
MTDETYFSDRGEEFYAGTYTPVWPSRHRERPTAKPGDQQHLGPLIETNYVRLLLNRLDELEKKTRPSGGDGTTKYKDLSAFEALESAGRLVEYVAGWAIDHQMGLASEGLKFVPLQPSGTKNHPQYLSALESVDSHSHEKAGALLIKDDGNAETARRAVINLLRANPGAMPSWLQYKVIEGLEALDYGEVQPIFEPLNTGRKRDLTLLRLQLRAVAMIAYRRKLGMTKEKAVAEVAGVLNQSPNTLLSWEARLKSEFGALEVERTISFAQNHASWVEDARKKRLKGEEAKDTDVHEANYNEEALIELGKKYSAALKAAKSKD